MIKIYDKNLKSDWNKYLDKNANSSVWHHDNWFDIFEKLFHFENNSMLSYSGKSIIGILPLYIVKNIFGKKFAISSPFANFSDILADDIETEKLLINEAINFSIDKNCSYLELRSNKKISGFSQTDIFVTMVLDLSPSIDDIWNKSLKAKTRNQVRKAQKSNLDVVIGNDQVNANDFYEVYTENISRLGTPVFPKKYFKLAKENFNNDFTFVIIKKKNIVIAGLIIIIFKDTCYIPYASSLKAFNYLCPNNLLYWEAIKYAKKYSLTKFDFGRSTINTGTYKFKLQWGAKPVQLYYNYKLFGKAKIPQTNALENKYSKLIKIWSKLPTKLAVNISSKIIDRLPEL